MKTHLCLTATLLLATHALAAHAGDNSGYYLSGNIIDARQHADGMNTSARPGIGGFAKGKERDSHTGGSLAGGYDFGNGWRVEGEYVLKQTAEFTSGSSRFANSFNHHRVQSRRAMLNGYRDIALTDRFALYGSLGLGVSMLESTGWQGNPTRQFAGHKQNNLSYAIGAGASFDITNRLTVDLGYRYIGQGQVESGPNLFTNVRGLTDEQMRLDLSTRETTLGLRYRF